MLKRNKELDSTLTKMMVFSSFLSINFGTNSEQLQLQKLMIMLHMSTNLIRTDKDKAATSVFR